MNHIFVSRLPGTGGTLAQTFRSTFWSYTGQVDDALGKRFWIPAGSLPVAMMKKFAFVGTTINKQTTTYQHYVMRPSIDHSLFTLCERNGCLHRGLSAKTT
jgi:hypothetical protein